MIGSLISFIVIGLLAGWIVGKMLKGQGFGLAGNLMIGIVGSVVGGVLFWVLGFTPRNIVGSIVTAVVGALFFLFVASELRKRMGGGPPAKR